MKKNYLSFYILTFFIAYSNISFAQLAASFTGTPTSGCGSLVVSFTNTSTGPYTTSDWNFGNGNLSSNQNPSATYNTPGTYTVTLTVSNSSTSSSTTQTNYITVYAPPVAEFNYLPDTIVCLGAPVTFISTSSAGAGTTGGIVSQWNWTFGDGGIDNTNDTVTHSYTLANTFPVTLTVTDIHGCVSTIQHSITSAPGPVSHFTTNITSCEPAPITLNFTNNTSGTWTGFLWNFGDPSSGVNDTSTNFSTSHIFDSNGSYSVSLTAFSPGCNVVFDTTLNLLITTAGFTQSDTAVCAGSSLSFTNTTNPVGGTFHWNFGDPASGGNNTSTQQNPSHTFLTVGIDSVTLISTVNGCLDTIKHAVHVRALPVPQITAAPNPGCSVPDVVTFQTTNANIAGWQWNFNDSLSGVNNTSTNSNPSHTYNNFGIYHPTVTITDIYGCSGTYSDTIYVESPHALFFTQDSGCVPLTVNFSGSPSSSIDSITQYIWNFGDGTGNITSSTSNQSHTFNAVGIYDVQLVIVTQGGCRDTLKRLSWIKVGTRPNASFTWTPDTVCFGQPVQFTSTTPMPVTDWVWNFGDGGSSSGSSVATHIYNIDTATVNPFTVTLTAYYNGCADDTVLQHIITVLLPIPDFTDSISCENPYTVYFHNTSRGATGYSWNFGDGTTLLNDTNPVHTFSHTGDFLVTLTDTNSTTGCSYFKTVVIHIRDPKAHFTWTPVTGCYPLSVFFNDSISQDAVPPHFWNFGDPLSGSLNTQTLIADTITHVFDLPGFYTVNLTIHDLHGCPNDSSVVIHVLGPTAGFTFSPDSSCSPFNVTYHDTSHTEGGAITQWNWSFGDGFSGSGASPFHTYSTAGIFYDSLIVQDANGCKDTAVHVVHSFRPTPSVSFTDTTCPNMGIPFVINSGSFVVMPVTYHINYGDGGQDNFTGSTTTHTFSNHQYTSNNTYTVTIDVTDSLGCDSTITAPITILKPIAHFNVTATDTCIQVSPLQFTITGVFAVFTDSSTGLTGSGNIWNWSFDYDGTGTGGVTSSLENPPGVSYYTYGNHAPQLVVINGAGCASDPYTAPDIFVGGPQGTFTFSPTTGCHPLLVNFNGTTNGGGISYTWDFGDGSVAQDTSINISHIYHQDGIFNPYFFINYTLSSGSTCRSLGVDVNPAPDTVVIVHTTVTVDIDSSSVTLYHSAQVGVLATVTDVFGSGPYTYSWTPSSEILASDSSATLFANNLSQSAYYYCTVTNGQGCEATDSVLINYIPCSAIVGINIDSSSVLLADSDHVSVQATANSLMPFGGPPYTYVWSPTQHLAINDSAAIIYAYNIPSGTYYYCTVTDSIGCKATDSVLVLIKPCDALDSIPNIFTPNGDGLNDTYYIKNLCPGINFKFTIYNRWGKIIYEATDNKFRWDGKTTGGTEASDGTYYYVLNTGTNQFHGFIELIRNAK